MISFFKELLALLEREENMWLVIIYIIEIDKIQRKIEERKLVTASVKVFVEKNG